MSRKPAKAAPQHRFNSEAALRELVDGGLAPLLEPLGYSLEGGTLRRDCRPRYTPRNQPPEAVFLIELMRDKTTGNEGCFSFELGVHHPRLIEAVLEMPYFRNLRAYLSPPKMAVCGLRQGLGELAGAQPFPWYVGPGSDLRELTESVTVAVLESGLPWLQERLDWRYLLHEGAGVLHLAAWKLAGPRDEFRRRLSEFLESESDAEKRSQFENWGD